MNENSLSPARASRRDVLLGGLTATVAAGLPAAAFGQTAAEPLPSDQGTRTMSTITTKDGAQIYYKDWGAGPVVTFSHGWPLSSDAWDSQMLFLAQNGFRCVAHDRRGHGRSSQVSFGNDMDTYADDLAAVIEALDLKDVVVVGHSTGGGEVTRYIGRHGTKRVAKAVLIAAIPPGVLGGPNNPDGLPPEAAQGLLAGLLADRSQFYRDLAAVFYGANRPGSKVSQGILDQFWAWSMQSGLKNSVECAKAVVESDFTEDLKKFDVPTLIIHGEDDQVVPFKATAPRSAKLIKNAKTIYYPGAPHGITATHQDEINKQLLAFLKADV
jgi:non-heme chloroperoxidase